MMVVFGIDFTSVPSRSKAITCARCHLDDSCLVDAREALDHAVDDAELTRDELAGAGYFLPVISDCASDKLAEEVLERVTEEQDGDSEGVAYHLRWARLLRKAFEQRKRSEETLRLGDIAYPSKVKEPQPSVVVDVQYGKTGILDLDTGELKYYALGYLTRVRALSLTSSP